MKISLWSAGFVILFTALPWASAAEPMFEEFDDPALPESGFQCQGSITREEQPAAGDVKPRLFFVNATSNRTNLTVRVSADDGKTWSAGRTIQPGPAAYSSVALLQDGTLGVLYEAGKVHPYEKISFARFNLEWLTGRQHDSERASAGRVEPPAAGQDGD